MKKIIFKFKILVVFCFLHILYACSPATPKEIGINAFYQKDFETAKKNLLTFAEQGDKEALLYLGCISYEQQEMNKSLEYFQKAAKHNSSIAQFNIGQFYFLGLGLKKNENEAVKWFKKAAEHNSPIAQVQLAACYADGKGTDIDNAKALELLQMAAKQNYSLAFSGLGEMYYRGKGVEKNYIKSFEYFQKAAKRKEKFAQYMLGKMYIKGQGVEKNLDKGVSFIRLAAENGDNNAQVCLGFLYLNENKTELAEKWFEKAKKGRIPEAQISAIYEYVKMRKEKPQKAELLFKEKLEKIMYAKGKTPTPPNSLLYPPKKKE